MAEDCILMLILLDVLEESKNAKLFCESLYELESCY